jgi:hypothetical protein
VTPASARFSARATNSFIATSESYARALALRVHVTFSSSRALRAVWNESATTATPVGNATTALAPGTALAAASSTLSARSPCTGAGSSDAYSIPGRRTSMP